MNRFFLALFLSAFSLLANAAPVTVIASGPFTGYYDPESLLPFPEPTAGTNFELRFTYDDQAMPSGPPSSDQAIYIGLSSISLTIGNFTASDQSGFIVVRDDLQFSNTVDPDQFFFDQWAAASDSEGGDVGSGFGLLLETRQPVAPVSPLTSTSLVSPFLSPEWQVMEIYYDIFQVSQFPDITRASARALVTNMVITPLPAPILLFISAFAALYRFKRR